MPDQNGKLPHGLLRINSHLQALKPAERKVADYILENPEKVIHLSITKLAGEVGVSEATVVKFCQHIGYSGYQELKIFLAQSHKQVQGDHIYGEIEEGDNQDIIIKKIFQIYDLSLSRTRKFLQESRVKEVVNLIDQASRIFFFGFGASGIVARDAELKFKRIGYQVEALEDNHLQKTIASLMKAGDLVFGISDSGRTKELIDSLSVAAETGGDIVAITSHAGSPITKIADQVLLTSSRETSFRGSALASRMSQLAVIDVLFLGAATVNYERTITALEKTRVVMQETKL